jgi:hypothetical protein
MGVLFMVLGLLAFASPPRVHNVILGLGFGVLHTVFGMLLGRVGHGE